MINVNQTSNIYFTRLLSWLTKKWLKFQSKTQLMRSGKTIQLKAIKKSLNEPSPFKPIKITMAHSINYTLTPTSIS
jgi:hypothetical protein